jgi:competence protein ComEC
MSVYLLEVLILKFNFKNLQIDNVHLYVFNRKTGFNIYENQRDEVLLHDFYKHKVFSVKKGNKVFWIDRKSDKQKVKQFIINPYCFTKDKSGCCKTIPDELKRYL